MKSTLIAACATGALALLLLPAAVLAVNPTPVSVTVTTGTTITAPAAFSIGSGFPGQTVTTVAPQDISWWSNETGKTLTVTLDTALTSPASNTIAQADVEFASSVAPYTGWVALNASRPVADIADVSGGTNEAQSAAQFDLRVNIPSAAAGTYSSTLTWTVQ